MTIEGLILFIVMISLLFTKSQFTYSEYINAWMLLVITSASVTLMYNMNEYFKAALTFGLQVYK